MHVGTHIVKKSKRKDGSSLKTDGKTKEIREKVFPAPRYLALGQTKDSYMVYLQALSKARKGNAEKDLTPK